MKKLAIVIAATAAAVFAPNAFAQASNFQGFSVAGGLNVSNSTSEITRSGLTATSSGTSNNIDAQVQYALAFGEKFVVGLGVSVGLTDYDIAADTKMKNTTGFFVTPGYALSDTLLAYGKVGAINGKFAIDNSISTDMSGIGYGLGVKSKMNKNLFLQGELVLNQYDDKTVSTDTFKSKATFLSFGVGYQF